MKATIVFNEHEYVIQLKKEDFSLDFLGDFISRIQREERFFQHQLEESAEDFRTDDAVTSRFDHLDDK